MEITAAALCGFLLDLLLGDPEGFPHPVVRMGRAISWMERRLRRLFPATPRGERCAGLILATALPLMTVALSAGAIALAGRVHPALRFVLEVLWSWQALAMCCLRRESESVRRYLNAGDLPGARKAVGRIVGRDTERLDAAGVARAAVETVAENFSDGEIAPLFYLLLGGAPLALGYKAVNTMDSMVGYKNERFLHFGRAAAKLDDAANFLPARISALLLILAAPLCHLDGRAALRVWRRDRRKHASPNSAQTEAAMAGALGLKLLGPASYFGKPVAKPWIGDEKRPIEPGDIRRANRLMYVSGVLGLAIFCAARTLVLFCLR